MGQRTCNAASDYAGAALRVSRSLFDTRCSSRGIRDDFVAQIRRRDPLFGLASDEQRTCVLLADDTPQKFDNVCTVILFLSSLRAKRGWILWPPGVGLTGPIAVL